MYKKAVVFLNGKPPKNIHKIEVKNTLVVVVDGAYNYISIEKIPFDILIGDLDSVEKKSIIPEEKIISIADQNTTDFEKTLEYLYQKNISEVSVYGGSGKEQDHYLGNLYAALRYKNKMKITMFDHFSYYYFCKKEETIQVEIGKKISLFPFPNTKSVTTKGLQYPLLLENLSINDRIGTRNVAIDNTIQITFLEGELLVFIEK